MKNAYKTWLRIAPLLLMVSCSPIQINDHVFYGDKGIHGATAVHSLKTEIPPVRIAKPEWDKLRIGMICTDADTVADLQASIDKLCSQNKSMCYYAKDGVDTAKKTLSNIQKVSQ